MLSVKAKAGRRQYKEVRRLACVSCLHAGVDSRLNKVVKGFENLSDVKEKKKTIVFFFFVDSICFFTQCGKKAVCVCVC